MVVLVSFGSRPRNRALLAEKMLHRRCDVPAVGSSGHSKCMYAWLQEPRAGRGSAVHIQTMAGQLTVWGLLCRQLTKHTQPESTAALTQIHHTTTPPACKL